jgi:hypothetical protein
MPTEVQPTTPAESQPQDQPQSPSNHADLFSQSIAPPPAGTPTESASPPAAGAATPPPQAAPVAPVQPSFRELATKAGLQADGFTTDQELFEAILNERRQLQPLATLGRQYAPHVSEFEQYLQQLSGKQPDQAAKPAESTEFDVAKHFDEKWGAPAWDSKWDFFVQKGMLTTDEDGLLMPKPGYEAMVAPHIEKMNQALEAQQQKTRDLFRGNPFKAIDDALTPVWERRIEAMIEKHFGSHQAATMQQTEIERFEQQYASVLYAKDATGQQVLTPQGEKLVGFTQRMVERGFSEAEALQSAAEMMGLTAQAPAPAAVQAPVAPSPAQISTQKAESFLDQARRNASQQPNSAPYSPIPNNPTQPFVSSEVELANMWSQAAQAAN